jgi:hypothetical protein
MVQLFCDYRCGVRDAGFMVGGVVTRTEEGSPQGGPISPVLSNLYLNEVDRMLEKAIQTTRWEPIRTFCRWHAGTDVELMGCKPPDPNRPFGDLAGGQVCGASHRLK